MVFARAGAAIAAAIAMLALLSAVGTHGLGAAASAASTTVTIEKGWTEPVDPKVTGTYAIAFSDGFQYGPIDMVAHFKVLEQMFPNAHINYITMHSTPPIRDAIISGQIIAGSCATPPFLIGWNAGAAWGILTKVADENAALFVRPDGPKTLAQLVATEGKIMSGPGTTQDFALRAELAHLGLPTNSFATRMTLLPHADAYAAFRNGQLVADFANAEFAVQHQNAGDRQILDYVQAYGARTAVAVCAANPPASQNVPVLNGYRNALQNAVKWMNANPAATVAEMSKMTNGADSPAVIAEILSRKFMAWNTEAPNVQPIAKIMTQLGLLKRSYTGPNDFYLDPSAVVGAW